MTVASFGDVLEANLAKGMLEAEGIDAYLADGELASMAWHLTGAVGGIKLQVSSRDEKAARALLAAATSDGIAGEETYDWEADIENSPEDSSDDASLMAAPDRALTSREKTADRALRGALLGVLFFPIQFYVWWLLVDVAGSEEPLAAASRNRAIVAAIVSIPYLIIWLLLLGSFVGG